MFYVFIWVVLAHFYAFLPPYLIDVLQWILTYGSYFVMSLLVVQMGLYLGAMVEIGRRPPKAS